MKILNKKGFTLVELLVVIVILAIVSAIALRTILPYMSEAGRDSFAIEASEVGRAASDSMTLILMGKVKDTFKQADGTHCFTLQDLKGLGQWTKDDDSYVGRVVVDTSDRAYKYYIEMHNGEFYVKTNNSVQVHAEDISKNPNGVGTYSSKVNLTLKCS